MRGKATYIKWLLCVLFLTWPIQAKYGGGTEDIWWILEGQDYPCLWWESAENGG